MFRLTFFPKSTMLDLTTEIFNKTSCVNLIANITVRVRKLLCDDVCFLEILSFGQSKSYPDEGYCAACPCPNCKCKKFPS